MGIDFMKRKEISNESKSKRSTKIDWSVMSSTDKQMLISGVVCVFAFIPFGIALAMLVPDDILSNPIAKYFTDFMSFLFPRVQETGLRTSVPSTQFIIAAISFMALFVSVLIFIPSLKRSFVESRLFIIEDNLREKPIRAFIAYFFGPILFMACSFGIYFVPYKTFKEIATLNSKFGMGTYGTLLTLAMYLGPWSLIFITKSFYILKKRKFKN